MSRLSVGPSQVILCDAGGLRVSGADHLDQTTEGIVFHRLPRAALDRIRQPFMRAVEAQPTGVTLSFVTRADDVRVRLRTTALTFFPEERPSSFGTLDLYSDGILLASRPVPAGGLRRVEFGGTGSMTLPGDVVDVAFSGLGTHSKTIEIWLPHDVEVELVDVLATSAVAPAPGATGRRWVHYGSSISHGMNATCPSLTWPAVAARRTGLALTNLGFAGNAVLDQFVARAIRDLPADLISTKIGINVLDYDGFRTRTFISAVDSFLDTIRDGHPTTPVWVISPILSPAVEDRPGPVVLREEGGRLVAATDGTPEDIVRGRLCAESIRTILAELVADRSASDPHLRYLDGRALYGEPDAAEWPLLDGSHPEPDLHQLMGVRFAEHLEQPPRFDDPVAAQP